MGLLAIFHAFLFIPLAVLAAISAAPLGLHGMGVVFPFYVDVEFPVPVVVPIILTTTIFGVFERMSPDYVGTKKRKEIALFHRVGS